MAGAVRTFGGLGSVALLVGVLASGCGDSDSELASGGGAAGTAGAAGSAGIAGGLAAGVGASAGESPAGTGGSGVGGESGGAAGEGPPMGGSAGAPTPSNEGGAAGEAPECGPLYSGPRCEFKKLQSLYPNPNFASEVVVGLSRDGRFVTTTSESGSIREAHRISLLDGAKDILMPSQASNCTPTAISEDGSWVAGFCLEEPVQRPFYWTKASGAVYYDPTLGIRRVQGRSADGQVLFGLRQLALATDGMAGAGGGDNAPSDVESVFRWGADGSVLSGSDGPPDWPYRNWPVSVLASRDGSHAIINVTTFTGTTDTMVYRWSAPDSLQPMVVHTYGYYDGYFATDVARDLDITIGDTETCDARGCGYYPLIWHQNAAANYIEGDGAREGFAIACNRDCSIIAGSVRRLSRGGTESGPGIWTNLSPANADHIVKAETHFLVELLGATTELDGWSLGTIEAMSDDGKVIAGNGMLKGQDTGWVIHL